MKILYVSSMPGPLISILTGKKEDEITSLPPFFHPWYKLVQRGHKVDFVVCSNFNEEINIKVDWFKKDNLYANIYDPYTEKAGLVRIFRRIKRFLKLMNYTNKAINENRYDFIYCKAYEGLAGNIVANIRGIPCGIRSFGTSLYNDIIKYGVMGAAIRRPFEYLTYKINKDFFITTDDGCKGDIVYDKWKPKKKKYDFYFWETGIDIKNIKEINEAVEIPNHNYLFFASRIDPWKRHDRVIKTLACLHKKNIFIHLYFAGEIYSQSYYEELVSQIKKYQLENFVHFLGSIKQSKLKIWAYHALANVLMQDHSNRSNIFFEFFSVGSIVIGINNGTLDKYIKDGENGFLVNSEKDACVVIEKIINNKSLQDKIKKNAERTAREQFMSIDERFNMEVDLIERVVAYRKGRA